jgi:hypothetical protein
MRCRVQRALILIVLLATTGARAQVFRIQGGDSTLLNAQGASVEFKAPDYDGSLGLGFYNGKLEFGANTRYLYHGYSVLAGDEAIPFTLPTDVFDASHYFSARGMGVTRGNELSRFYAFAGTTSTWVGTGFFSAATSDRPAGIFFYERKWNRHFKFFSRDIVSNTQTALQGVEWQPNKWLKTAVTSGTGSNQKYFASSVDVETEKLALKSSYVVTGDQFQRITVMSPLSSEVNKGNVQMLYRPNNFVSITTGHENILEPMTIGGPMQQATVNQLSTDFHLKRFYFGTGLFTSEASGRYTQGKNFYLGRRLGQRIEVNTNYFESKPQATLQGTSGAATTILSATIREDFSSRFSFLQLISRTASQTTFAFGGDFTSNRFQFRADYQNVYLPFRPMNPFEQALALNVMLRIAGPLQATVASNVAPDGRPHYSFGLSTWLYRQRGMSVNAVSQDSFSIAKYVIQGVVKDEEGTPVEGAALHIGREVGYTDSSGHFQIRFSKHGPYALAVAPDEFISNAFYEVVSAPPQVRAERDDAASDIQIVLRHRSGQK